MTKTSQDSATGDMITPLSAEDLNAVVAIDQALTGTSRRDFFQRRLDAALEDPDEFVYVGLRQDNQLIGYALARLVHGEFGKPGASAALDAIGVNPAHQGQNVGSRVLQAVEKVLRHKGVSELTSQVRWADQYLLAFFANVGFEIAPRVTLARPTTRPVF